jgi:hypothetical protein
MADNSATLPQDPSQAQGATIAEEKGKGKAPAEQMTEDTAMDEDDDDDSDDDEEEVCAFTSRYLPQLLTMFLLGPRSW